MLGTVFTMYRPHFLLKIYVRKLGCGLYSNKKFILGKLSRNSLSISGYFAFIPEMLLILSGIFELRPVFQSSAAYFFVHVKHSLCGSILFPLHNAPPLD